MSTVKRLDPIDGCGEYSPNRTTAVLHNRPSSNLRRQGTVGAVAYEQSAADLGGTSHKHGSQHHRYAEESDVPSDLQVAVDEEEALAGADTVQLEIAGDVDDRDVVPARSSRVEWIAPVVRIGGVASTTPRSAGSEVGEARATGINLGGLTNQVVVVEISKLGEVRERSLAPETPCALM